MKQLESEQATAEKNDAPKEAQKETKAKSQGKAEITFDDFAKIELKLGTIIACEKHPKADRLLVEKIDLGNGDVRQIVSGIAQHFSCEDLIGQKVVVVTNLKSTKLRGILSEGMILCAGDDSGLDIVSVKKALESGTIVS